MKKLYNFSILMIFAFLSLQFNNVKSQSCNGNCGGSSSSCYCDDYCWDWGDCCADICTYCGTYSPTMIAQCGSTSGCSICPSFNFGPITPTTTWNTHSSSFSSNQCKIYQFNFIAGHTYYFSTCTADGGNANFDTFIELYNAGCTIVASNNDFCGLQSFVSYTAINSGYHYLKVKGFGSAAGNYTLAYKREGLTTICQICPAFDFIITPTSTYQTHSSSIATGACRVYKVDLLAGDVATFTFCEGGGFANYDTYLTLRNAACVEVAWDDDHCVLASQIIYTAPVSGTYYLEVNSCCTGNSGGTYILAYKKVAGIPPGPCSFIVTIPSCGPSSPQVFSSNGAGVWNITNCGNSTNGQEVVYQFTPTITGNYSIEVTSTNNLKVDYFWKTGTCSNSGWNCIDDISTPGNYGSIPMTAGTTYFILADAEQTALTTQTFYIKCPPSPCDSIITISDCGASYTQTYTSNGSGQWNINNCGFATLGKERIYQFTPAVSGVYNIVVTSATGGYVDYFWKTGPCNISDWNCIDDVNAPGTLPGIIMTAGTTYYFLLDAEPNTLVSQTFYIKCAVPPLVCPPNAIPENEPDCFTDYEDITNGGCNSTPPVFQTVPSCGFTLCGKSGNYLYFGSNYRDTDWFSFTTTANSDVHLEIVAEFDVTLALMNGNSSCPISVFTASVSALAGETISLDYTVGPGTWYIWVAPSNWNNWPCNSKYILTMSTVQETPVPTSSNNPACSSVTINPIAPIGTTQFYWQGTSCGTSTSNPAINPLLVSSSGLYFVRGYNQGTNCWSDCKSIHAIVLPNAPDPIGYDQTVCSGNTATLQATGTEVSWWNALSGGALLGTGNTYITPVLTAPLTVYAQNGSGIPSNHALFTAINGVNTHNGNMFDVLVTNTITIDSIYLNFSGTYTGATVEIYYKSGSYNGFQSNASAWTLHQTIPNISGSGYPVKVPIQPLTLMGGQTYGMYITLTDPNQYLLCSNVANTYADANINITTGSGLQYPFASVSSPRTWNGSVIYSTVLCPSQRIPVTAYVDYPPTAPGSISGQSVVCEGASSVGYSIATVPTATSYQWNYTGTGATINGSTENITIDFASNATSGLLSVAAVNHCGSGPVSPQFSIMVDPCVSVEESSQDLSIEIIPNPNDGKFICLINSVSTDKLQLRITDVNGKIIWSDETIVQKGVNYLEINLSQLANGMYLFNSNGNNSNFKKILVVNK